MHGFKLGPNAYQTAANINRAWGKWSPLTRQYDVEVPQRRYESWKWRWYRSIDGQHLKTLSEENRRERFRKISQRMGVSISINVTILKKIAKLKTFDQLVPLEFGENQSPLFWKVGNVRNVKDQFIYWMMIWDEKSIIYENRKQGTQWLHHDEGRKPFCKTEIASSEYILSCGPPLEIPITAYCNLTRAPVRKFTASN